MAKSDLILTPYQVFILPCIILIFWSLFLIVFKSDGSGTWRRDIDWFILNQGKQIPRFWFVFNETEEVCSCVTGFERCNIREIKKNISNREKDYLCTCPTHFNHGVITYCTKSNYQKDILEYEDEIMDLFLIRPTNNCQHYGGYSIKKTFVGILLNYYSHLRVWNTEMPIHYVRFASIKVRNENTSKEIRMYWNIRLQNILVKSENHTVHTSFTNC